MDTIKKMNSEEFKKYSEENNLKFYTTKANAENDIDSIGINFDYVGDSGDVYIKDGRLYESQGEGKEDTVIAFVNQENSRNTEIELKPEEEQEIVNEEQPPVIEEPTVEEPTVEEPTEESITEITLENDSEEEKNNISEENLKYDNFLKENTYATYDDFLEFKKENDPKLFLYYTNVNNKFGDSLSFDEKMEIAKNLQAEDKNNNYRLLHSTPILAHGTIDTNIVNNNLLSLFGEGTCQYTGDYLMYVNEYGTDVKAPLAIFDTNKNNQIVFYQLDKNKKESYIKNLSNYYADIMDETSKYSPKYKNMTLKKLKNLSLVYALDSANVDTLTGAAAYTNQTYINSYDSKMLINVNTYLDKDDYTKVDDEMYQYMIGAFNHEIGHVFNNATGDFHPSEFNYSDEWKELCVQIEKGDPNHTLLRDYAHSDPLEMWAEAIAEYYGGGKTHEIYNPNDLKAVTINYKGYTNLYDYINAMVK